MDVKGDALAVRRFCKGIEVEKVWSACRLARGRGVHIEITTLLVPTVNDSEAALRGIAERLAAELGPEVPWHVTGYSPAYQFKAPPTLLRHWSVPGEIGRDAGLKFVYVGNVPFHRYNNTYCPTCDALLIRRFGFEVAGNMLRDGCCPHCARSVAGVWGRPTTSSMEGGVQRQN